MKRSAAALTLVLAAAVVAVCGLAWIAMRGSSSRSFEQADNSRVALPSEAKSELAGESQPLEARSVEQAEAATQGASGSSQITGTGTLRLRVLDEKTREPIPDLGYLVFRERGGRKDLARGRTDAGGRAELNEIEANTVIVRTERKPPHAEATGAVWLVPGGTKELELLVGAGGALTGRVIDDLEHPVAGAEVWLSLYRRNRQRAEPEALSGPDGRFRIECLASNPRSVWIVDGEMRPEAWEPVWIDVSRDNVGAGLTALPVRDRDVDVGDIRLTRATIYSGHLRDAGGSLVAGAVLSLRGELERGPVDPEFQLQSGDVLSDAAGRFELRAEPGPTRVLVSTRAGQNQSLRLPQGKPGERVDDIELQLSPETIFELELVDAGGARATVPAPVRASPGVDLPWRQGRTREGEPLAVFARNSDGARLREGVAKSDPDGKWRVHLQIDPARIGEFEIAAAGYQPVLERSATGFPALVQRRFELTAFPTLRVRLVPKDPEQKLLAEPGEYVSVVICMADPARHARASGRCCGLGAYWYQRWRGQPLELVLPVRRQAPFWIYVRGPRREGGEPRMSELGYAGEMRASSSQCDLAHSGPFEPGPEVHEFALDPADFVRSRPEEQRKPPEKTAPGEDHRPRLRARVTDARTGKGLKGAWISFGEVGVAPNRGRGASANSDENGDVRDQPLLAGRWNVRVKAHGYGAVELGERTTREGETIDLGAIALEPYPRHRMRILGAEGEPLARVWLGLVLGRTSADDQNGGMMSGDDGGLELLGELSPSFVMQAAVPAMHSGWGAQVQRFVLEPWPEDEVKELRLAKGRKVVVTLTGLDPEEAGLVPFLCPAPGEPTGSCDHRSASTSEHPVMARGLELDSAPDGQRYAFLLAPGRYQLWGSNLMHELPLTELEVVAGDTDIELTLTAH